jgi:hypothetical protein
LEQSSSTTTYVGAKLLDPGGAQVSVGGHVVVAGVDDALIPDAYVEHGRPQHVACIVGPDLQLLVHLHRLMYVEPHHCRLYHVIIHPTCSPR